MKSRGYAVLMILMLILLNACSMEALRQNLVVAGESGYNYTESRKQWVRLRGQYKNTYSYTIFELSVTNTGSETSITVQKGKVMSRYYEAFIISEDDGTRTIIATYSENAENLNSHPEGAPAVTIDELYDTCLADYLSIDPENNTIYFDTNQEGVISLCGYVPDLCGDDCFIGFDMSRFSWGN